jgi:hypothetical protein
MTPLLANGCKTFTCHTEIMKDYEKQEMEVVIMTLLAKGAMQLLPMHTTVKQV